MSNYFRVMYYLLELKNHPYMRHDELVKYRERRLRKVIEHAYAEVPYYHRKFKESGVLPDDIRTVGDLTKLPIIRKGEMRNNISELVSKRYDVRQLAKHWTSGSTGQPLLFYVSKKEDDFRKAKHLRGNIDVGQKPNDRWVTITPPFRFTNVSKLHRLLGIYSPIPLSVFHDPATQISIIERVRPDLIDGYSSSLLLLARELEKRNLRTIKPRLLFGGAELTDEISQNYIEEVFDAPFFDRYATVELERMAWQCSQKMYHIDADTVILEFVDEEGEAVSAGERGEVVCTSLFNYATPFIRYAIGDMGTPSDDECPCGRTFPLMKVVEGRKDSRIILPDGRQLSPRTFTLAMRMFELYKYIDQFRVIQERSDLLRFRIKKKDVNINEEHMKSELVAHIKNVLDLGTDKIGLVVEFADEIPLDKTGKLMAVVSKIGTKNLNRPS